MSLSKLLGLVIGLEGSIGVGKTTFGHGLKNRADSEGIPCSLFTETAHEACLKLFLKDPVKYGALFQVYMLSDCQNRIKQAISEAGCGKLCVVDRTPWGNTIFEHVNHKLKKNIDADSHMFYESVRDRQPLYGVNYVLFFDLDPQTCLERMGIRGNVEELAYHLEYFKLLDQVYFEQVIDNIVNERCPVVIVPPLPLNLQSQIIRVLDRVHTRTWRLPTVVRIPIDVEMKPSQCVNDPKSLSVMYETCRSHLPEPYLGESLGDEDFPLHFNYKLYEDHPNQFRRCVMWTLASLRSVVFYNYTK